MKFLLRQILLGFLPSVPAHFLLNYPETRGFDEDKLVNFPCGGQDTPSSNRTPWPLTGGPIQLNMQHDRVAVQVLLGLGDDVGPNFNITLVPTFEEEGFGDFCMGNVVVPSSLGIKDGQKATIQVVTSGDPSGGLYNCADITFTSGTATSPQCKNGTGVVATTYTGQFKNANQTNPTGAASTGSTSGSPTAGASGASTAATARATKVSMGALRIMISGVLGVVALL